MEVAASGPPAADHSGHANPSPAATQQLPQMNANAGHSQHAAGSAHQSQAGSSAAPAELSSIQYQQLQQLQFQSMQWQYLQQLQQQQMWLQQQQQQGQFDPQSAAGQQSTGSSQYRSAYQSYGEYPSEVHQPIGTQQQQQQQHPPQLDADGNPIEEDESARQRYRNDNHAPSIDPSAWNDSVAYASKSNPDRYMTHRTYFSHIEPVVDRLPRKPELKELVIKGRDFYTNNRDPRFYNPVQESGWDNRSQVVKYPVTHPIHGVQHSTVHDGAAVPTSRLADPNAPEGGVRLPHVEEAKEAFGQFPVLVDNQAASTRAGSKLLIPFLHHWPPPFRFDFLKKHSRAPLSPFLASLNGYEVPQELFMSAKQRSAKARAEAAQQREQQGYGGAYPPPANYNYDPAASGSHPRPDPQSVDPIERARARANTHTTYWRTVPPAVDAAPEEAKPFGLRTSSPQKSRRPEWNFRHQLIPPQPRVGQTQPRNATAATGRKGKTQDRLSSRQQAKNLQHQHQDAQMPPYMYDPSQPLPPLLLPNGQPMVLPPYFHPGQPFSMEQFMQQQMMMQQQQQHHQQQQQFQDPYDPNAYPQHAHDHQHAHDASSYPHPHQPAAAEYAASHPAHEHVSAPADHSHSSLNEHFPSPAAASEFQPAATTADSAPAEEQQAESTEM